MQILIFPINCVIPSDLLQWDVLVVSSNLMRDICNLTQTLDAVKGEASEFQVYLPLLQNQAEISHCGKAMYFSHILRVHPETSVYAHH